MEKHCLQNKYTSIDCWYAPMSSFNVVFFSNVLIAVNLIKDLYLMYVSLIVS